MPAAPSSPPGPPTRAFIAYDFALIEGSLFANVLEDARDIQPSGLDIHYPGDDGGPKEQGTIWGSLVKAQIEAADKFIAFVDLPNANVGFEIGYACGMGKPVGVYRFKDSEHPWLKEPPLRGHFRHQANDAAAIHAAFLEDHLLTVGKSPSGGEGVTVLCPPDGALFLRQIDSASGWRQPPLASWNLDDTLPKQFADTGLVVWIITPHGKGAAERDGTENTCLSILAGYAEARPELDLRIFIHTGARPVADMEHCSQRFTTNAELKQHFIALEAEWKGKVEARNNPASPPTLTTPPPWALASSSKPSYIPPHPEDVFQHDEKLFIGREAELKTGVESVIGMMARFRPGAGSADSGFRLIWAYGFGGMGKSWYLHRIRCRAETQHPEIRSLVVDWDKPDWRAPLSGEPRVDSDLFDAIATRLCQRLGPDAADAYWQAKDRIAAVAEQHRQEMDRFGNQFHLACTEETPHLEPHFRQLLRAGTLWDDKREKRTQKLAVIQNDSAGYRELFGAWCRETGQTDAAVICPGRARAEGLRTALRAAMKKHPLILMLDTCEVLSHDLDGWLRELLAPLLRESLPLLVLIGSRLRPDLHQPTGVRKGWREDIPQVHLHPLDFGEIRRFTVSEIHSALNRLTRPFGGDVGHLAETLHRSTLGIPLAVRTVLDMHNDGAAVFQDLPDVNDDETPLSEREAVRKVIGAVAARFLLNLIDHPEREEDLRDIIALALLPAYDQATLSGFWEGKHTARIRHLAGRYSLLSDGDLHPSVRFYLRRHWRSGNRPDVFDDVLSSLREHSAAVRGLQSPPTIPERIAHLSADLNLRSWQEGDIVVDELSRALCLARVYEVDATVIETLLTELPLAGSKHTVTKKLWHRDREESPPDAELVPWLQAQCAASHNWSDEEQAGLALLEGIAASERYSHLKKALAAFAALEKATDHFGLGALPKSAAAGTAYFNCGWSLYPSVYQGPSESTQWVTQSAKCFERAIALHSREATARNNVAVLYESDLGQPERAEQEYLAAIALAPKDAPPHYNLAVLYQGSLGQPEKAEQEYRTAIALDPKLAYPHNGLGNLYQDHFAQPQKAEQEYLAAIALDPTDALPHNGLGSLYQNHLGQPQKAEQEYLAAIALDPKYALPHNGLGWLYQNHLGQPQKAEQEFLAAIALDPNFPAPHNGLGWLYQNHLGQPQKAEQEFLAAIALDPNFPAPRHGLGSLYHNHLGQPQKAEQEFLAAISLDPNFAEPHNGLGPLYEEAQRWNDAASMFQTAIQLDKTSGSGQRGLAWVTLLSGGEVSEAKRWAAEAAKIGPKHPGTPLADAAVAAWAEEWASATKAFADWVSNLPKAGEYLPWTSRHRVAALLRKACESGHLGSFTAALKPAADRGCWQPWAKAVEAWLGECDPATLADPKHVQLYRLLTNTSTT